MSIFKKRETPIQNIAYMSIMAAINVIFVLLSNILPVLLFLLIFLLPLTSAIVTIYCKKRYYPIYFMVTLALCIAVASGFSIFDTLIYVFPSLLTGFIFGLSFEKEVPAILVLVGNTVLQFSLSLLTFLVLGTFISNLNMMNVLINAFGLSNFAHKESFSLIFLYVISMIQITLSYILIKIEMKRFNVIVNLENNYRYMLYISSIIFYGFAIISYFYFPVWTIVFVLMPLPIYIYELATLIVSRQKLPLILAGATHLAFIFIFAFLYRYLVAPNQLLILIILFGLMTIIDILSNYCFANKSKQS